MLLLLVITQYYKFCKFIFILDHYQTLNKLFYYDISSNNYEKTFKNLRTIYYNIVIHKETAN